MQARARRLPVSLYLFLKRLVLIASVAWTSTGAFAVEIERGTLGEMTLTSSTSHQGNTGRTYYHLAANFDRGNKEPAGGRSMGRETFPKPSKFSGDYLLCIGDRGTPPPKKE